MQTASSQMLKPSNQFVFIPNDCNSSKFDLTTFLRIRPLDLNISKSLEAIENHPKGK